VGSVRNVTPCVFSVVVIIAVIIHIYPVFITMFLVVVIVTVYQSPRDSCSLLTVIGATSLLPLSGETVFGHDDKELPTPIKNNRSYACVADRERHPIPS